MSETTLVDAFSIKDKAPFGAPGWIAVFAKPDGQVYLEVNGFEFGVTAREVKKLRKTLKRAEQAAVRGE